MPKSKRGDNRADDMKWGESKVPKTFLLTPTASEMLDDVAERLKATRSEALEQLIRYSAPITPDFKIASRTSKISLLKGKRISAEDLETQQQQLSLLVSNG